MTEYSFYTETYLAGREAVIDAASFPFWERRACSEVRKYTFGNINENQAIPEVVQLCVCEVAEWLYKQEQQDTKGIASEKVGEYSVSYKDKSSIEKNMEIYSIIRSNLSMTGYLYSGVM